MRIIDRGTVFMGEEGSDQSSACFHSTCTLPSGRWLTCFRSSPAKKDTFPQKLLLTWSDDNGHTWTDPVEPFGERTVDGKPGGWRGGYLTSLGDKQVATVLYWVDTSDPTLTFFNPETEGLLDSRIFLSVSDDEGVTWSEPDLIDTAPFNVPTALTGPMLLLPDGTWILQFETNKHYCDKSTWHHASVFMFSRDQGKTWPDHVKVAADPEARVFYWDQRPSVLRNGDTLDMFWTFDRVTAEYLNIHARSSADGGKTWSSLWDTGIPGQPAPPVMLSDGSLVMPYVDRENCPVIKLRCSRDGGRTWPQQDELILDDSASRPQQQQKGTMQDAWSEMGAFSVGLPTTCPLPDDRVLVSYYAGATTDHTGIHWILLAP